jgi:hypothetical protein
MAKPQNPDHVCCATGVGDMWYKHNCGSPAKVQDPNDPTRWYCGVHARQYIFGYENPAFAGTTPEQRKQARLVKQKARHPEKFCSVEGCFRETYGDYRMCARHRWAAERAKDTPVAPAVAEVAAEVQDLLSPKK